MREGSGSFNQVGEIEHLRPIAHDVQCGSIDREFLDDRRQPVKRTPRRLEPNLSDRGKISGALAFTDMQGVGAKAQRVGIEPDRADGYPAMETRGHTSPDDMTEQQRNAQESCQGKDGKCGDNNNDGHVQLA
jgi:hypothetical protein